MTILNASFYHRLFQLYLFHILLVSTILLTFNSLYAYYDSEVKDYKALKESGDVYVETTERIARLFKNNKISEDRVLAILTKEIKLILTIKLAKDTHEYSDTLYSSDRHMYIRHHRSNHFYNSSYITIVRSLTCKYHISCYGGIGGQVNKLFSIIADKYNERILKIIANLNNDKIFGKIQRAFKNGASAIKLTKEPKYSISKDRRKRIIQTYKDASLLFNK
jgi:hypothetical protein